MPIHFAPSESELQSFEKLVLHAHDLGLRYHGAATFAIPEKLRPTLQEEILNSRVAKNVVRQDFYESDIISGAFMMNCCKASKADKDQWVEMWSSANPDFFFPYDKEDGDYFAAIRSGYNVLYDQHNENTQMTSWDNKVLDPNQLDSMLSRAPPMPGINQSMSYTGVKGSTFGAHVEDNFLYAASVLITGAPKIWFLIQHDQSAKLHKLMRDAFPEAADECPYYMRHKQMLFSPDLLRKRSIKFSRIVQKAGTFLMLYPGVYHFRYSSGLSISEAVNFCFPPWEEWKDKFQTCEKHMGGRLAINIYSTEGEKKLWQEHIPLQGRSSSTGMPSMTAHSSSG